MILTFGRTAYVRQACGHVRPGRRVGRAVAVRRRRPARGRRSGWCRDGAGKARRSCLTRCARRAAASSSRPREATDAESLRRIGAQLGDYAGRRSAAPADWHEVLDALLALGADRPVTVVIDEFPYLAKANPVAAVGDPGCVRPAQRRTAALPDPAAAVRIGDVVHGRPAVGDRAAARPGRAGDGRPDPGLPAGRPVLGDRATRVWRSCCTRSSAAPPPTGTARRAAGAPQSVADLDELGRGNVLSRFSPLFREARYLLAEEPDIRDNALYHSVLAAVAEGNATRGGIAAYLERKATDISHHLSVLEDAGLLAREVDAFRPGRSIYRISEPLIAFYHAIMRPEWSRLERRRARRPRSGGTVPAGSPPASSGPRFEQICRDWVQAYAPPEINGIPVVAGRQRASLTTRAARPSTRSTSSSPATTRRAGASCSRSARRSGRRRSARGT